MIDNNKFNEYSGSTRVNSTKQIKILDFINTELYKADKVLDVGCGNGYISQHTLGEYIGLTNSDIEVENLKINDNQVLKHNLYEDKPINLKDESVDLIYCSHIIEHFEVKDVIRIMKELYRILKKGGKIYLITPTDYYPFFYAEWSHVRPYNHGSLPNLLKDNGFKNVEWCYPMLHKFSNRMQSLLRFPLYPIRFITHKEVIAWGIK